MSHYDHLIRKNKFSVSLDNSASKIRDLGKDHADIFRSIKFDSCDKSLVIELYDHASGSTHEYLDLLTQGDAVLRLTTVRDDERAQYVRRFEGVTVQGSSFVFTHDASTAQQGFVLHTVQATYQNAVNENDQGGWA